VALFFALGGRGDDSGSTAVAQDEQTTTGGESEPSSAPAQTQTTSAPETTSSPPPKPTIERIIIRSGKPVGGVKRLEYQRGERVRFSVRTDAADEVHVHGFEIENEVPANGSVRFDFPADIEGVFEVELHEAGVTIAELRIQP
jgi:hypothetical protein